jgi:hypothetical protein
MRIRTDLYGEGQNCDEASVFGNDHDPVWKRRGVSWLCDTSSMPHKQASFGRGLTFVWPIGLVQLDVARVDRVKLKTKHMVNGNAVPRSRTVRVVDFGL